MKPKLILKYNGKTCFDNSADIYTAINELGKFPLSSTTSALLDNVSVKQASATLCPEGKQSSSMEKETCALSPPIPTCSNTDSRN